MKKEIQDYINFIEKDIKAYDHNIKVYENNIRILEEINMPLETASAIKECMTKIRELMIGKFESEKELLILKYKLDNIKILSKIN
jgi:hypothetical protein